jgi:LDH2 family malate/lactate/ureidoglycolate dehydrogenase
LSALKEKINDKDSPKLDISYIWRFKTQIMYSHEYLFDFTRTVFIKMGCSEEHATMTAKVFLAAELRGLSSHGMIRIKDYYQLWEIGRAHV